MEVDRLHISLSHRLVALHRLHLALTMVSFSLAVLIWSWSKIACGQALLKRSTSKTIHFCYSKGKYGHGNISMTKLWRNSVHHICSVTNVAQWWFSLFRHRYSYIRDDLAPVTELFQLAYPADTCMMDRLTRVQFLVDTWRSRVHLHGVTCTMTWQHVRDDMAGVT
jgi:hypothetical protein